jgi:hypothetical protein
VPQDFGVGRVAKQHRDSELLQALRADGIGFNDESCHADPAEDFGDVSSHSATSHDDYVSGEMLFRPGNLRAVPVQLGPEPLPLSETALDGIDQPEHPRI